MPSFTTRLLRCGTFAAAIVVVCHNSGVDAQTAANVLVVINEESAVSREIGAYYARQRGVPESNVIRIRTSPDDAVTRAVYADTIERPIAQGLTVRGLQDRILYIVLTKGVPLKVSGRTGLRGDAASVDSELTLLYRKLIGREGPVTGTIDNPYYLGAAPIQRAQPFRRRDHDIYLVTRLDGFSVEDVIALIDRAQAPSTEGRIVLDRRNDPAAAIGDLWLVEAAAKLRELGHGDRVDLVETLPDPPAAGGLLGYYSWGSNDPANRRRRLGVRFAPGAVAATLAGTDADTFATPPDTSAPAAEPRAPATPFGRVPLQSLTADLIREGVTGAGGNVSEPLLASSIRPQVLFPAYLSGFNLAEAFYLALPHLSWQSVIVGDPLCRPFTGRVLGSADLEEPAEPQTGLPGIFAGRRMQVIRGRAAGASPQVVSLIVRAEAQFLTGDRAGARASLEQATALRSDLADQHLQLAMLYEESLNIEAAVLRYRRVLELQPRNALALNNLAYRLAVDQGNLIEAMPMAKRAALLDPQNAQILDTLGWIHYLVGNQAEAARILEDAARRIPRSAEVRLHAAFASMAVGLYSAGEAHLAAAIRLAPHFESRPDVKELRAKLVKRR